ncbi:MAG: type II toxin-antitoxin system RelE/ParE family toxin [Gloeobacteraceae cyanobacterium ES-bin-316]|nr:type II toxin-antitoxin system RelE/ParE family toxin [Ferruginibacter sp.]
MAKVTWAPSSIKDISAIAEYIAKDSLSAAKNMVNLFFEKAKILEQHPEYGKPVPETKNPALREILVGRYRIIYEVYTKSSIGILTVHHQSRLVKSNPSFKKRLGR